MPDMAYAVHTRSCTYLLDDDGICRWTLAPTGVPVPGADRYLGAQFVACLDVREQGGLVGELRIGAAALFARSENGRLVLLRTPQIEFVEHRADGAEAIGAVLPTPAPPMAQEPSLPSYPPYVEPPPAYAPRASAAPPAYTAPPYAPPPPPAPAYQAPEYVAPAYRSPEYSASEYSAPAYVEPEEEAPSTQTLPLPLMHTMPLPLGSFAQRYASAPEVDVEEELLDADIVEELVTFSEVTLTIPLYRPEAQVAAPPQRRGVIGPGRRLR